MQEGRNAVCDVTDAVCDGLRQIGDFSYAILPKDLAHACGEFNKAVLAQIRRLVDWESNWIDDRVAGGDRMRDEWKEKCNQTSTSYTSDTGGSAPYTAPDTNSAPGV
jgi:hypothetical protein